MTVETIVRTLASRGPFVASDVTRACQSSGARLFSGTEIGDVLRAMESAGEIVPSGTYVDPTTRKVLFRTGRVRPASASREDAENAEFRAFASMMGLNEEPVRVVETPARPGAPVETPPAGVSAAEDAEFRAFASMLGADEETLTIATSGGTPVERRPAAVSPSEQAEYEAWAATFGGDL